MKTNTNGHPASASLLANLVVPGVSSWDDGDYAKIRLRLDCYDDFVLAQKYESDKPKGGLYALDPLDVTSAIGGLTIGSPLLPEDCLFWQRADGAERLGIYVPPQVWPVNVSVGGSRERLTVPMPGLVWVGQGTAYRLYAVKGVTWPGKDTELWKAPCPNVSDNICRGNVEFPAAAAGTIRQALGLFFESDFNDHLSNGKSKRYPRSVLPLWRELSAAGAEAWPEGDLESAGTTLGKVAGK
jgi:PRTRC genetic system protein B